MACAPRPIQPLRRRQLFPNDVPGAARVYQNKVLLDPPRMSVIARLIYASHQSTCLMTILASLKPAPEALTVDSSSPNTLGKRKYIGRKAGSQLLTVVSCLSPWHLDGCSSLSWVLHSGVRLQHPPNKYTTHEVKMCSKSRSENLRFFTWPGVHTVVAHLRILRGTSSR